MFGNLLYFLVVLMMLSSYVTGDEVGGNKGGDVGWLHVVFLLFLLLLYRVITRFLFRWLKGKTEKEEAEGFSSFECQESFNRLALASQVGSLFFFAAALYLFQLKECLGFLGIPDSAPLLQELAGLFYYLLFLIIYWSNSFSLYSHLYGSHVEKGAYLRSQLQLNLPMLAPWFLVSLFYSGLEYAESAYLVRLDEVTKNYILLPLSFFCIALVIPAFMIFAWNCRPLPEGKLKEELAGFCHGLGLKYKGLHIWNIFEGKLFTAGIMGLIPRFRYILVTPTLLSQLSIDEIKAVLAHESGHTLRHHIHFYALFFLSFILFSLSYPSLFTLLLAYSGFFDLYHQVGIMSRSEVSVIGGLVPMLFLLLFYFRFLFGYISRNFEREADLFAMEKTGGSGAIASSLEKIGIYSGNIREHPNWHHYSIKERVDYLKLSEENSRFLSQHKRKAKRIKFGIALLFLLSVFVLFSSHRMAGSTSVRYALLEKTIKHEIAAGKGTAEHYYILGEIYNERKEFQKAIESLKKSIQQDPYNAEAYNNIAWIYATAEEESVRNYRKGLEYGLLALNLKRAPHILDTVAECYYLLGEPEKAIELEEEALAGAVRNRAFYHKQLKKFMKKKTII